MNILGWVSSINVRFCYFIIKVNIMYKELMAYHKSQMSQSETLHTCHPFTITERIQFDIKYVTIISYKYHHSRKTNLIFK